MDITLTVRLSTENDVNPEDAASVVGEILNDAETQMYFRFNSWGEWRAAVKPA